MKEKYTCDFCGTEFYRYPSKTKGRRFLFCSRQCAAYFSSAKKNPDGYKGYKDYAAISSAMRETNARLNPYRMTTETREKLRNARLGSGEGKSYTKTYGRHTHRVVAEKMLGRALLPGEVVHHINGDKRDNRPENLLVFKTQAEHARHHKLHG